jgi:hypothetical protein
MKAVCMFTSSSGVWSVEVFRSCVWWWSGLVAYLLLPSRDP